MEIINNSTALSSWQRSCPCGKVNRSSLQRIHRAWYMRTFLFWLEFKRYKCDACNQKKWLFD